MDKVHFENIIKSFFLGLFMGVILVFADGTETEPEIKVMAVLASGSIGFLIGFLTEWITSILPISLAKARTYFFINNLIALLVTALILGSLVLITRGAGGSSGDVLQTLFIVLGIICAANLFDYGMYRRAQRRLETYKARMRDK